MKEAMDVLSTKILTRKQSVPSGDCRGSYYRAPAYSVRRTTDAGLPTFDSKSSTPALLEPVDLVTDCSRPVSSMSSSIAVDEITSLPGSPFYRQVLQRRSSSIDSSIMSRPGSDFWPGSDFLDIPIFLVQPQTAHCRTELTTYEPDSFIHSFSHLYVTADGTQLCTGNRPYEMHK